MSHPHTPTSYDTWKHQKHQPADATPADTPQHKHNATKHAASAPKRIPVQLERAAASRRADISSGITDSLNQIALKKKQKQQAKKAKKKFLQAPISDDSNDDDDVDRTDSDHDHTSGHTDSPSLHTATALHAPADAVTADSSDNESDVEVIDFTDADDVAAYRQKYGIDITSATTTDIDTDPLYYPVNTFAQLTSVHNVDAQVVDTCTKQYGRPTLIQQQCWPVMLNTCDLIGIAHTGSGKTLTYLLPIYHRIMSNRQQHTNGQAAADSQPVRKATALILAPTRELVLQIASVAQSITDSLGIQTLSVHGGPDVDNQLTYVHSHAVDILVCTLGRLIKLMQHEEQPLKLDSIDTLVLDEADRILDLGFEADLLYIVSQLPSQRQTVLFSATFPQHVETTASKVFAQYDRVVRVHIGNVREHNVQGASSDLPEASRSVKQIVEVIDRKNGARERRLMLLLDKFASETPDSKFIVFCLYKREASAVCDYLKRKQYNAVAVSGDKSQAQRAAAMQQYRANECNILVATDVAARGLDIADVTHVINFSVGLTIEQYVHRIGRCGRAGKSGVAYTFFVDYDLPVAPALVDVLRATDQTVSAELLEMSDRAKRKASKHSAEIQVRGDAAFRRYDNNEDDEEQNGVDIDEDDADAKYLVRQPKKQHAIHKKGRQRGRGR